MQLSDDDLRDFCEIWKWEFNQELTIEDARQYASQLLELYALLAKPLPTERKSRASPNPQP